MRRKTPVKHKVKRHTRRGKPVRRYTRGKGSRSLIVVTRRRITNTPNSIRGKSIEYYVKELEKSKSIIDSKIYPLDYGLTRLGYITGSSCQGHMKVDGWEPAYVAFISTDSHVKVLKEHLSILIKEEKISLIKKRGDWILTILPQDYEKKYEGPSRGLRKETDEIIKRLRTFVKDERSNLKNKGKERKKIRVIPQRFAKGQKIDMKIRNVVILLNERGFETQGSCAGHKKTQWKTCFVSFYIKDKKKYNNLRSSISDLMKSGKVSLTMSPYEKSGKMLKVKYSTFEERDRILKKLETRIKKIKRIEKMVLE